MNKLKSFLSVVALSVGFSANATVIELDGTEVGAYNVDSSYTSFADFYGLNTVNQWSTALPYAEVNTGVFFVAELNSNLALFGLFDSYSPVDTDSGSLDFEYSFNEGNGAYTFVDDAGGDQRDVDQFQERGSLLVGPRRIALVDHQHRRFLQRPEPPGDLAVHRCDALLSVDDKHQQLGLVDPHLDLPLDLVLELIGVVESDAAGVDQLDVPFTSLDHEGDPIAGDSGRRIDHRHTSPCQPVQQRTLADIRSADDRDAGHRHGTHTARGALRVDDSTVADTGHRTIAPRGYSRSRLPRWQGAGGGQAGGSRSVEKHKFGDGTGSDPPSADPQKVPLHPERHAGGA